MNWFYFRDDSTGTEIRWDKDEQRLRLIDPVGQSIVNQSNVSLVQVIQLCSRCLARRISED